MDFTLISRERVLHMVAPTKQDKLDWVTDINQCIENVHHANNTMPHIFSSSVQQFAESDPSVFEDDVDIKFSQRMNNYKVPQIRSATPERLLQTLTDLRFLSMDFLTTFLMTYPVFSDGVQVLQALMTVWHSSAAVSPASSFEGLDCHHLDCHHLDCHHLDCHHTQHWRYSARRCQQSVELRLDQEGLRRDERNIPSPARVSVSSQRRKETAVVMKEVGGGTFIPRTSQSKTPNSKSIFSLYFLNVSSHSN